MASRTYDKEYKVQTVRLALDIDIAKAPENWPSLQTPCIHGCETTVWAALISVLEPKPLKEP